MQPIGAYRLFKQTGAVLENPVSLLPSYYEPWNRLAEAIGELCEANRLREFIKMMPLLEFDFPLTYEELRFAHKILAFAASTYIWSTGEKDAPKVLPAPISVPLVAVSLETGIPPILTHQDLVLCNCATSANETAPDVLNQPTQHKSWKHFIGLSGLIEISFAPIFSLISDIVDAQNPLNEDVVISCLTEMRDVMDNTTNKMSIFFERLDSTEFYKHLRPIMCGWNRKPIQNGLIFEGVTRKFLDQHSNSSAMEAVKINANEGRKSEWTKINCIGANAAQSICLQALDTLLEIRHEPKNNEFFHTMRKYMIPEHRSFLRDLKSHNNLAQIVRTSNSKELRIAFNNCVESLRQFRDKHLQLVVEFIEKPATRVSAKVKTLESTGTGGQALRNFLLSVRNSHSSIE
ncbi:Indoleamine 2 3-dioxygenase [Fasciolopsis buskii]|uniref:Indoleamine 2 3-dioxygenase n=1 Tax=Fasciolopsis buskii TaxID=27845 RepID=A0A8E0VDW2_9TREM|nr:Indoleamine 2 3-dioxygenase [Fasciolopsis buski]